MINRALIRLIRHGKASKHLLVDNFTIDTCWSWVENIFIVCIILWVSAAHSQRRFLSHTLDVQLVLIVKVIYCIDHVRVTPYISITWLLCTKLIARSMHTSSSFKLNILWAKSTTAYRNVRILVFIDCEAGRLFGKVDLSIISILTYSLTSIIICKLLSSFFSRVKLGWNILLGLYEARESLVFQSWIHFHTRYVDWWALWALIVLQTGLAVFGVKDSSVLHRIDQSVHLLVSVIVLIWRIRLLWRFVINASEAACAGLPSFILRCSCMRWRQSCMQEANISGWFTNIDGTTLVFQRFLNSLIHAPFYTILHAFNVGVP